MSNLLELRDDDGKLHCDDGAALIDQYGNKFWYQHGKQHREDGPATEYTDGSKFWFFRDMRHRIDGPASEYSGGRKDWFYFDERIECSSQEEFEQKVGIKPTTVKWGVKVIHTEDPFVKKGDLGHRGWTKTDRGWETWYLHNPFPITDINIVHREASFLHDGPYYYYRIEEVI